MTLQDLIDLRKRLGLTQAQMGDGIGLGGRAYQKIEAGDTDLAERHVLAAERLALRLAVERGDPMLAPVSVRRDALALAQLLVGRPEKAGEPLGRVK